MSAIAPASAGLRRPSALRARVPRQSRPNPLSRLDRRLSERLGVDLRLIYGMGVPMLFVLGAMIRMFGHPTYLLVGSVLVLELLCLALIVIKSLAMLDEPDQA